MSRPTEVLVKVEDLEAIAAWRNSSPQYRAFCNDPGNGSDGPAGKAIDRIITLIPEPEWEPSEEQIEAFAKAMGYDLNRSQQRGVVAGWLKTLNDAGLVLP